MKAYAAQMKRVLMSLGVAVLALIGLAAPLIQFSDDADPTVDPVTISDYRADYRVAHDGELTARESISTLFPPSRHGIFRFWDVTDAADPHVRYIPDAIAVTLDGHAVPVELSWEANRRFRVTKIGDPDSYLSPGTHVFVITYRVDGVLAPARAATAAEPPTPLWLVSVTGHDGSYGFLGGSGIDSFESSLSSSLSAYAASQSASLSTGGGSFSGGGFSGGGGGGGGGSW